MRRTPRFAVATTLLLGQTRAALAEECTTPNAELFVCRDELRDLSDRLRLTLLGHPDWSELFLLESGVFVPDALDDLADALEERTGECPCIGPCTSMAECADS